MFGSRTLRLLDGAVEAVATAAFIVMFLAALAQVLFRYVLQLPVPWTEELARTLFTWSMLFGIAVAIRRDEHIRVEVLTGRLGPRARAALLLLFHFLVLALLASLARGTAAMLQLTWGNQLISLDWMHEGHLYLVQLAAVALMILSTALGLARNMRMLAIAAGRDGAGARSP